MVIYSGYIFARLEPPRRQKFGQIRLSSCSVGRAPTHQRTTRVGGRCSRFSAEFEEITSRSRRVVLRRGSSTLADLWVTVSCLVNVFYAAVDVVDEVCPSEVCPGLDFRELAGRA